PNVLRVGEGQPLRGQRLRVEGDLAGRLVPDPDLLNPAADFVVLHRRRLAGYRQREGGHDRRRTENDPGELQHRAPEVVLDVADAVDDGLQEDHVRWPFAVGRWPWNVGQACSANSQRSTANEFIRPPR